VACKNDAAAAENVPASTCPASEAPDDAEDIGPGAAWELDAGRTGARDTLRPSQRPASRSS